VKTAIPVDGDLEIFNGTFFIDNFLLSTNREEILYEKEYLPAGRNYLAAFCLEH